MTLEEKKRVVERALKSIGDKPARHYRNICENKDERRKEQKGHDKGCYTA